MLINPDQYKDVFSFTKKIRLNRFLLEALNDIEGLGNVFPQFIVNNEFNKILTIRHIEAQFCRWSQMEKGQIKYCGISSEWGISKVTNENSELVAVADPWFSVEELKKWLKDNKIKKFMFQVSSFEGNVVYQTFKNPGIFHNVVYQTFEIPGKYPQKRSFSAREARRKIFWGSFFVGKTVLLQAIIL